MKKTTLLPFALLAAALVPTALTAAIPDAVPYQGRIAASGTAFTGTGYFKFAVYQQTPGTPSSAGLLWTNANSAPSGAIAEPSTAVSLPVASGLFAAGLGDTAVANMAALPASLAPAAGQRAYVRVWFSSTGAAGSFQALSPDTELRSVPFAREAANTTSIGGVALANLAQLNAANTFNNVNGLTVTGTGPANYYTPASGASVPITGPGTRMEFLPGYGAFRAGTVDGTQWDVGNIGIWSTATGYSSIAKGSISTAMGILTTASGYASTAMGVSTTANGDHSTAMGAYTTASGYASTAMGIGTTASSYSSTAIGYNTAAMGYYTTAMGVSTTAASYAETAIGNWNTQASSATASNWVETDRLFVVGNGTMDIMGNIQPSDALVMLKNGDTTANGNWKFNGNSGLIVTGNAPTENEWFRPVVPTGTIIPQSSSNSLMMYIPGYAAFRAGIMYNARLTAEYIGAGSVAMGWDTIASGHYSTAMGYSTRATGFWSTAMGDSTTASGHRSTAMGYSTRATGDFSTAMGLTTQASGSTSTAMGEQTHASGNFSTAMGYSTGASGESSTAMGYSTSASSYAETALGCFNTTPTPTSTTSWSSSDRVFVVGNGMDAAHRSDALIIYKNGNAQFGQGVWAASFITTSDRNAKTDIVAVDTAAILAGVASLPISTWKFKTAPGATHLGPMAQDFSDAFKLGDTNTGIATVDADGVALAAIQELNKRVTVLTEQNTVLLEDSAAKDSKIAALEARLKALEAKLGK